MVYQIIIFFFSLIILVNQQIVVYGYPAEDMVKINEKLSPNPDTMQRAILPRTLVIYNSSTWKIHHSVFFEILKKDGHTITMYSLTEHTMKLPKLDYYGERLYDNIIMGSLYDFKNPTKSLTLNSYHLSTLLFNFLEKYNGNIFVMELNSPLSLMEPFLHRLGIRIPKGASPVKDFFNNIKGDPNWILTSAMPTLYPIVSTTVPYTIAYKGMGHVFDQKNRLFFPLLTGAPTTYSDHPVERQFRSGSDIPLISAFQSRHNERVILTDAELLCDNLSIQSNPNNLVFCREISQWVFHQRGILEWSNLSHQTIGKTPNRSNYRIKDTIEIKVNIHELVPKQEKQQILNNSSLTNMIPTWYPFSRASDIQLEFTMLDPHWRLFLEESGNSTNIIKDNSFSTVTCKFKCPDRYGIFKTVLNFSAKGFSFFHIQTLTPVRNYKHNDYERFIWCASPYYLSTFISMILVVLVSITFLYPTSKSKK